MIAGVRLGTASMAATMILTASPRCLTGGDWPDGPNKQWFQSLQRPDADQNPWWDAKSRSCCGAGDVVKTKFRVEKASGPYFEDSWYAWVKNEWVLIPHSKIVNDHAPDGQPYLFMLAGTIVCFVRPKGGT
jgi:hypothetical protein